MPLKMQRPETTLLLADFQCKRKKFRSYMTDSLNSHSLREPELQFFSILLVNRTQIALDDKIRRDVSEEHAASTGFLLYFLAHSEG
jgi:hypothetical protein